MAPPSRRLAAGADDVPVPAAPKSTAGAAAALAKATAATPRAPAQLQALMGRGFAAHDAAPYCEEERRGGAGRLICDETRKGFERATATPRRLSESDASTAVGRARCARSR